MKTFFEYMYYRIADLNFTKDYERAIVSVTGCQFSIILNLYTLFMILVYDISRKYTPLEYLGMVVVFFVLDYFNGKMLNNRFIEFHRRWRNDSMAKKTWGLILVFSFILFSMGGVFFVAWITDRLNF